MSWGKQTKNVANDEQQEQIDLVEQRYEEINSVLLAAGYFRARIKGLSRFDKIIGGLAWCITSANVDVAAEVVFHEDSNLGQKIKMSTSITDALKEMKCPIIISPHQIQGLDTVALFPVVQWLVKKVMEVREEEGDLVRNYAVYNSQKKFDFPDEIEFQNTIMSSIDYVNYSGRRYLPKRRFRQSKSRTSNPEQKIRSTLLEFGRGYGISQNSSDSSKKKNNKDKKSSFDSALEELEGTKQTENQFQKEQQEVNELMKKLSSLEQGQGESVSTSILGNLVGIQGEQISVLATEYEEGTKSLKIFDEDQQQRIRENYERQLSKLNEQYQTVSEKLEIMKDERNKLRDQVEIAKKKVSEKTDHKEKLQQEIKKIESIERDEKNRKIIQQLKTLVIMNENLRKQEKEFKANCRIQHNELKQKEKELAGLNEGINSEREELIEKTYNQELAKWQKLRKILGERMREIGELKHKIDDVPTRVELK
ncbi:coiled-coil domain-containing protein [Anaeramoeba flamelloides]|uniref:Coiled-coil domain-containing protein n=1 Tax=Anaeramoeba flamelloides TaxID=1746091 RepID=A0ABQ8XA46_9EUKA|nr:coiled-coil domain-containing protein [Anaeramoeba flamelloides]